MQDLLNTLYPWMHLIGRSLFGVLFIMNGMGHLTQSGAMTGYAASKGLPAPKLMVIVTGVMLLAGGVTVVLGWHRFIGAGLLVLFLFPTAFIMHAFWKETDPGARQMEMIQFTKDIALAGAALFIAYYAGTAWPMSLGG
jgi:uncharacterized membrane protein YphA (DoxX/SURF4 family)